MKNRVPCKLRERGPPGFQKKKVPWSARKKASRSPQQELRGGTVSDVKKNWRKQREKGRLKRRMMAEQGRPCLPQKKVLTKGGKRAPAAVQNAEKEKKKGRLPKERR